MPANPEKRRLVGTFVKGKEASASQHRQTNYHGGVWPGASNERVLGSFEKGSIEDASVRLFKLALFRKVPEGRPYSSGEIQRAKALAFTEAIAFFPHRAMQELQLAGSLPREVKSLLELNQGRIADILENSFMVQ